MQTAALQRKPSENRTASTVLPPSAHAPEAVRETGVSSGVPLFLQRFAAAPPPVQRTIEQEEDEPIRAPVLTKPISVNAPDDPFEKEADRVADTVMRMPAPGNRQFPGLQSDDADTLSWPIEMPAFQKKPCCDEEPRELKSHLALQKKPEESDRHSTTISVERLIQSGGSPIPETVRSRIEPVLGKDLSHVIVHTDTNAHNMARSIHAKAFTHLNHIYLGRAQNSGDLSLMAHEATHVAQQGGLNTELIQRSDDDITRTSITENYAEGLTDQELLRDIDLCRTQLITFSRNDPEYQAAEENLRILDAELNARDIPLEELTACTPREDRSDPLCMRASVNAVTGIRLSLTADLTENRAARVRIADLFHSGPYLIAPNVTSNEQNPEIVFYIAYHEARQQNEWVIGPDSIQDFINNVALYDGAATIAYPGSERIPETLSGQTDSPESLINPPAPEDESIHSGGLGASSAISAYDAQIRLKYYVRPAQDLARQILADVNSGQLPASTGRDLAVAGRNEALNASRERLTPGGRAFSRAMKEEGKTVPELIERYSRRLIDNNPELRARYGLDTLEAGSEAYRTRYNQVLREIGESSEVSTEIIRAAGRPNRIITGVARVNRILGPIGTAVSLGISGYEIYEAPEGQRLHVAAREAGGFAGGTLGAIGGGMVGGWVASLACGPGAPVCALIVSVICVGAGGYLGGRAGEEIVPNLLIAPAYAPLALPAHSLSAGGGYAGLMERDRRELLDASRPLWMRLNEAIMNVEQDIRSLEGRIRTAENREELENLQRLRLDLMMRLEDLNLYYESEYPGHRRQEQGE
jgi:hypothetical protein